MSEIAKNKVYDIIIVGGGPGGLSCAIYALRAGKSVLMLERKFIGGQTAIIDNIENYPGVPNANGFELCQTMLKQAKSFGLKLAYEDVIGYELLEKTKTVKTSKNVYTSKTVVLAMGAKVRELDIKNQNKFLGKGLSYCATCDGRLFTDKTVAVVGGGNSAIHDALYLLPICKRVYIIHRRDQFRAESYNVKALENHKSQHAEDLELKMCYEVIDILGSDNVEQIVVKNTKNLQEEIISVDAVFVAVGRMPDTEFLNGVSLDKSGYILTDENMCTNVQGVYAVGDVRNTPLRQIVCACSDGAIASMSAIKYLES